MTIAGPTPVNFEQQRSELEAVLSSAPFVRAPKLAHLLSYLCERLFAGESSQIKEYSIGVEVFQRGAAFDQDSDSIVRVEANRLRKRLADYYATEGAGHRLQISIPLGQYVPEFVSGGRNSGAPAAAHELPPPAGSHKGGWWIGFGKRPIVLIASIGIVLLALGVGWKLLHQHQQPSAVANPPAQPALPPEMTFGPPAGEEVRILCGSTHAMVDHAGKLWSADTGFTGGTAISSQVLHIARTQNAAFYRTSRQGAFRYDIPLQPGIYELRLHFAELTYGPESTGTGGEGNRLMTVRANGQVLLSQFDVAADAGAAADVKVFPDISPAPDGSLHLEFASDRSTPAMVSAIEILPGIRGSMRPVRILARQTPYYSNDSHWWSPDAYFDGGQLATYPRPVKGTDDPEMFDTERWGNFTYAIPVSPGKYVVTLYFAARHGDWPPVPEGAPAGTPHVFNVFCNGKVLLQNFDLAREAGDSDVVVRRVSGLSPNAQGKLHLSFVPVQGYASITGIEVLPQ